MSKRFAPWIATAAVIGCTAALLVSGGASAASSAPSTLHVTLKGKTGISVSGSPVAGAVNVVATQSGKGAGSFGLIRLNPNEPPQKALAQGFTAVQSHHGDLNALTETGDLLLVSANAPGSIQTVMTPGTWIAVNTTSMGKPGFAQFTVGKSSSPAALPAAKATQSSIEFGFRGPTVLHNGTVVRAQNQGYLVHMIQLIGVRKKSMVPRVIRMLRNGAPRKAFRPYVTGVFVSLLNPASPGALQQATLNAKPGSYVEACFMNTEDGREHTQLGMERGVVVK